MQKMASGGTESWNGLIYGNEAATLELAECATRTPNRDTIVETSRSSTPPLIPQLLGDGNYYISGNARVHLGDNYMHHKTFSEPGIQQKILTSLSFPHMHERGQQISNTSPNTYQWMLQPLAKDFQQWDCFRTWIGESQVNHSIYWVHGKPGSGKSTIMKFLHDNLTLGDHMQAWANGQPVIKAQHFFWNSGMLLQKSLKGLYRSLLVQILEQRPELVVCVTLAQQRTGLSNQTMDWSQADLGEAFLALVQSLSISSKMLLMVDGLDECEDNAGEQEELIDLLTRISRMSHVKICISSRPWNIFKDAFVQCPQLCLEDLTRIDIQIYVRYRLRTSRRWLFLEKMDHQKADGLILDIIDRAEGVFLWVSLVVREFLRHLRDGDSLDELQRMLHQIPADLNDYFMRIFESIEPQHRREASALLQLALHYEDQFASALPVSLIDTLFIAESQENFVLKPEFNINCLNLKDEQALRILVDSALRKINSRCKNLLECHDGSDERPPTIGSYALDRDTSFEETESLSSNSQQLPRLFDIYIDFLHCSLRDFLLLPNTQAVLHQHTGGKPFDARLYLSSARVVQLIALSSIESYDDLAVGMASHIISALRVNRYSPNSALMALIIRDVIECLALRSNSSAGWYINESFDTWYEEQSTFLTLAIDFRLISYVLNHMTRRCIQEKSQRPILDYILRPRFVAGDYGVGDNGTDPELVRAALSCGADPNQRVRGIGPSLWALYLCFLADLLHQRVEAKHSQFVTMDQLYHFHTMAALISAGASSVLPYEWLESPGYFEIRAHWSQLFDSDAQSTWYLHGARLRRRWPDVSAINSGKSMQKSGVVYAVSDLVQSFACFFDFDIGPLVRELRSRE